MTRYLAIEGGQVSLWRRTLGKPDTEAGRNDRVGNVSHKVRRIIIQAFQRTIPTDDPLDPPPWQVDRANIGTYYARAFPVRLGR
ncbi:MAG: hypothetical protein CL878_15200 [Dehalococcoidia bacterium]|nr:hypothetical protein [Dehalococcoidia bacterium]